ncbi:DEAD/DEAH box helicase [Phormidium tenue]|uniref:DEAD/DEAH box helicase n=1 Tax=Phormidium tenue NIES-30 TaxID=549789 RepID=A0A1U7JB69_9CYAN|nr:DEAD/DEAH box helicase [Phormidium tenue]MBD2230142.1 DEAD/DEAH box helicase [Phormidium tenue FACHB-1052]OKH51028.1 DEAD/DEAH box helicase [Phormidium tenue NIES-30]
MLDLAQLFPFPLDDFQHQAAAALDADKSVVVCAPTGSGKTLIGEYAIYRAMAHGKRVFYTTPLKALSNQKLRDFRDQFGYENVGLLTGDLSINRDAPIVVMTTEIFRNMLYGTRIGETGTTLQQVEAVVLDECHYMNDRQRGTVWEESIIYCPPEIQLLALSATVENSGQLTDWLQKVHGPTELIYSDFRPVPLQFHYCTGKRLVPLLDASQKAINPQLKKQRAPQRQPGRRGGGRVSLPFVMGQLQERDMLPAIYFIFSRRGCDKSVDEVSHLSLVTDEEAQELKLRIDTFLAHNPDAGRAGQVGPLYRGIAAHHAGILPLWKGLVEELFQAGLIKVVFATETLAAGINMPARTTVIASLSKRTDSGHRLLTSSEFLQMAGRAGRRGMDLQGHVVTVESPFEGSREAVHLATSGADPLVSQFTPGYGMVLNLLQTHSLDEAKDLIERSFGQYLATLHLVPQQQEIDRLEGAIAHQRAQLAAFDEGLLAEYAKLKERLKEERRLLKTLQQQAAQVLADDVGKMVPFAIAGTLLSLKGKHIPVGEPVAAVLVTKVQGSGQFPYLVCLTKANQWYVVTAADVVGLHADIPRLQSVDTLAPPTDLPPTPGQRRRGDDYTAAIAATMAMPPTLEMLAPEVQDQLDRMREVEHTLAIHPASQWENAKGLLKRQRRLRELEDEWRDRQQKLSQYTGRYWQEFLHIMEVLKHFGGLADNRPTELGEMAAAIRGDNELWLALALESGEFDHLNTAQLAAAFAALVTENSRPDSWCRYKLSGTVEEALGGLHNLRRQLYQQQHRRHITAPIWLEYDLVGLVEQWANGVDWVTLCENTSLDEGDIVRILRRTLDVLSQIPHVPYISETLRSNAREAKDLMNRFPVNEDIG